MEFIESNMIMSFDEQNTYRIENAKIVQRKGSIKVCECFVLMGKRLVMIEAKTKAPKPQNFDTYIDEIAQKFVDTLFLYNAIALDRHTLTDKSDMPSCLQNAPLNSLQYTLYLIVYASQTDWMQPVQDALKQRLKHILKVWNIPDVNVKAINSEEAQHQGLIKAYLPIEVYNNFISRGLKNTFLQQAVEQWFEENK